MAEKLLRNFSAPITDEEAGGEVDVGGADGGAIRVHADGDAEDETDDGVRRDLELHARARLGGEAEVQGARALASAGSGGEDLAAEEPAQEERVPVPAAE